MEVMSSAQELVREVRDEVAELEGIGERLSKLDAALAEMENNCHHCSKCRCFEHINEALNSGDGTYKP